MSIVAQQVQLTHRPSGNPRPTDFELTTVKLPELREGQVLVENLWMSVDPYMRRSMDAEAKDLEPWPIGGALDGPSVGRVVETRNAEFAIGDIVESMSGWQSHFISQGEQFVPYLTPNNAIAKRNAPGAAPSDYVGLLGIASMTAYAAMACLAKYRPGQTVVISSGAGTVGSVACQIAKVHGARVVASAGSDEKVQWLRDDLDVDAAFNYRVRNYADGLAEACPNGIDLVLENASPEHLSACLPLMNELGQILISGFVSIYNTDGKVPPFSNFEYVLDRFLTVQAFRFMDSLHAYDRFVADMVGWRADGRLTFRETHVHGLANAPEAFCLLFTHQTSGKTLVALGTDSG